MTPVPRVPMSAEVMVAHLRPAAAGGNPLAATYLAAIERADNREAAAAAVAWSIVRLFESLEEMLVVLEPVVGAWTDTMGPN